MSNEKLKIVRNKIKEDGLFIYGDDNDKALARIYPSENQEATAERIVRCVNAEVVSVGAMKEFTSVNNVSMIEGKNFNWERMQIYRLKDDNFVYVAMFMSSNFVAEYNQKTKIVSFGKLAGSSHSDTPSYEGVSFSVKDEYEAEDYVLAFLKGKNLTLAPLYQK